MTDTQTPATPSLARLLNEHPLAAAHLERSLKRQQEEKSRADRATPQAGLCPHCGTLGKAVKVGEKVFYVRSSTCCQRAACDDALTALRYFFNPSAVEPERDQAGAEYHRLRAKIKAPELLQKLDLEAELLASIDSRVSAEGGYCQGSARKTEDRDPLVIVYDPSAEL